MNLRVEMLGTEEAVKRIKEAVGVFRATMNGVMMDSAEYVANRARGYAPQDTKELLGSIHVDKMDRYSNEYIKSNYFMALTMTCAPHARYAEFGTLTTKGPRRKRRGRPAKGATPEYQKLKAPSTTQIGPWAERHGWNVWALQKLLMGHRGGGPLEGVRGAKPHPYHYKAFFEDETFVQHREAIADAVVRFLEDQKAT